MDKHTMIGAESEDIREKIQEGYEKVKDKIAQYVKLLFKIGEEGVRAVA